MAARKSLSGQDLSNQRIINVADAQAATDAVTLQQLQAYVRGLSWKQAVVAASTANVTLTAPGGTMDGVTLTNPCRVLLKNQTNAAQNGIYNWTGAGNTLTRTSDATSAANAPDGVQTLNGGMAVYVDGGTVNADTAWTVTTDDPITVDTTNLTLAQFGGMTVYYNGNGLNLSSSTFSIKLAPTSGLVVDGTGLYVDSTIVVKKYAATVGDGSTTAVVVPHNLGTRDVVVCLYDANSFAEADVDVAHTSPTQVTLNFGSAPASGAYRCVVHA